MSVPETAPTRHIDARGLRCPMPVIRMEAALRAMKSGECLVILSDDPVAVIDIPHFCAEGGHMAERLENQGDACAFRVTAHGKSTC